MWLLSSVLIGAVAVHRWWHSRRCRLLLVVRREDPHREVVRAAAEDLHAAQPARAAVSDGLEAMNSRSRRGHHIDPIYSLGLPPSRQAASARAYVSRFNRGSSPVASVVAMYSSIRL